MGKECCRWRELWTSNARDGHSYWPSNTSDSGSYGKAVLEMVISTGQAIFQIVAATESNAEYGHLSLLRRFLIVKHFFLEKFCSNK
jgi:hypothetical protein